MNRIFSAAFIPMLFLILAGFCLLFIVEIRFPGLNYDELFFIHAARNTMERCCAGNAQNIVDSITFYVLPYHGALKAWIYIPILKVFGASLYSLRTTMFIFTVLGLVTLAFFIRRAVSPLAALLAICLIAFNPSIILIARLDLGELALILFFISGILYFSHEAVTHGKVWAWIPVIFFLVCGGFHRINFFWFSVPFLLCLGIVFQKNWRPISILASLNVFYGLFLYKISGISAQSELFLRPITSSFSSAARELDGLLSGRAVTDRIFLSEFENVTGIFWIYPVALVSILLFLRIRRSLLRESSWILIFLGTFLGLFACFMATARAERYWHIYPAWLFLIIALSALIAPWFASPKFRAIAVVAILPIFFMYGKEHWRFYQAKSLLAPRSVFSDAVMPLVQECEKDITCYDVDGAVFAQLVALVSAENKPGVLQLPMRKAWKTVRAEILPILETPVNRFIVLDNAFKIRPNRGDHLLDVIEEEGLAVSEDKEVRDSKGRVIFHLLRLKRISPRG